MNKLLQVIFGFFLVASFALLVCLIFAYTIFDVRLAAHLADANLFTWTLMLFSGAAFAAACNWRNLP